MRRRSLVRSLVASAVVLVLSGTGRALHAQQLVQAGVRVRVSVADSARQIRFGPRVQGIRGTLLDTRGDTVLLQVAGSAAPVSLLRSQIRRVDRSLGVPSRGESALRGMVGGAVLGAIEGLAARAIGARGWEDQSVGEVAGFGAAAGGAVGLLFGALSPIERWRRARLP